MKEVPDWPEAKIPDVKLPAAFDWRKLDAVTPVKNQVCVSHISEHNKIHLISNLTTSITRDVEIERLRNEALPL